MSDHHCHRLFSDLMNNMFRLLGVQEPSSLSLRWRLVQRLIIHHCLLNEPPADRGCFFPSCRESQNRLKVRFGWGSLYDIHRESWQADATTFHIQDAFVDVDYGSIIYGACMDLTDIFSLFITLLVMILLIRFKIRSTGPYFSRYRYNFDHSQKKGGSVFTY